MEREQNVGTAGRFDAKCLVSCGGYVNVYTFWYFNQAKEHGVYIRFVGMLYFIKDYKKNEKCQEIC